MIVTYSLAIVVTLQSAKIWQNHFPIEWVLSEYFCEDSTKGLDAYKAQFVYDAEALVDNGNIPDTLVINWDNTRIKYMPVGSWMMEKEGQK